MKNIIILAILMAICPFDPIEASCNPKEDCMRSFSYPCPTWNNPGRWCSGRYEDTVCAIGRKACQVSCAKTNSDASNYITQHSSEISRINSEIVVLKYYISREEENLDNQLKEQIVLENKIVEFAKAQSDTLLLLEQKIEVAEILSQSAIVEFNINELRQIEENSENTLVKLLAMTIQKAMASNESAALFLGSQEDTELLNKINLIFYNESQRSLMDLENKKQSIKNITINRDLLKTRYLSKLSEIQSLQTNITQQEARKFPAW